LQRQRVVEQAVQAVARSKLFIVVSLLWVALSGLVLFELSQPRFDGTRLLLFLLVCIGPHIAVRAMLVRQQVRRVVESASYGR
jgi:hypothetical protein